MRDLLIWVDENDKIIGCGEKMDTHIRRQLHRAFSVFLYNPIEKKMLLQRRAFHKYHSGGLLSNACCSHPRKDAGTPAAQIGQRLEEELGIMPCIDRIYDCSTMEANHPSRASAIPAKDTPHLPSSQAMDIFPASPAASDIHGTHPHDTMDILQPDNSTLYYAGKFRYLADYGELAEHEIDRVFLYCPDETVLAQLNPNPEEVNEIVWMDTETLERQLLEAPERFSAWFPKAYALVRPLLFA